jgi:hypothetical protein
MSFGQPITDVIQARFSCRTYAKRPIKEDTRRRLADLALAHTTGPFGTQARFALIAATGEDSEALRGLGTYGLIKDAAGFFIGATVEEGKALEDFGYLTEQLVLHATDLGLGTCWLGGMFARSRFAEKVSLQAGETIPSVVSVGYVASRPRAVDAVIRLGAGSHARHSWPRLFFEQAFSSPLSRDAAGAYSADLQRIDMGIAMCHFALTAREQGLEGEWSFDEPGIDKPSDLIEYTASWIDQEPKGSGDQLPG